MKTRHTFSAIASASLLGATMLIAAPTASAANTTPATLYLPGGGGTCGTLGQELSSGPNRTGDYYDTGASPISGNVGDTVTLENECSIPVYVDLGGGGARTSVAAAGSAGDSVSLTLTTTSISVFDDPTGSLGLLAAVMATGASPSVARH